MPGLLDAQPSNLMEVMAFSALTQMIGVDFTFFQTLSNDLWKSLSKLSFRIATEQPSFLEPYNSSRLIALHIKFLERNLF